MSHSQSSSSAGTTFQSIIAILLTCYGSLENPNFRSIYPRLGDSVHRQVIDQLRKEGVEVVDTTDTNNDVSNQLVAIRDGDEVSLGLSGVGPFATVIHHISNGQHLWVTHISDASTPLAILVVSTVERAGFELLDRNTVGQTIPMSRPDGTVEATLYQALFTDSDIIP